MIENQERYGDAIFSRQHASEDDRLSALAEALDTATVDRLARLQPQGKWTCLDIGAGLGTISYWLAKHNPGGQVVALDLDTSYLHQPNRPENLEILQRDVTRTDFPEAGFDLIHARWVFSHLADRDTVLARVVSWLKPGGWLYIEDLADFPIHSSPDDRYRKVSVALCSAVQRRIGTSLEWARAFPRPLWSLGLTDVRADAFVPIVGGDSPMSRFWRHSTDQLADDLRDDFDVSTDDLDYLRTKMRAVDFADFSLASIATWGRRGTP
ncbi:trans-aconitate 2-methyltransferase [Amycolatopsis sp. cg5]|uniref:trans-aconitate 2-methyltransferase n=1 Tax=Amycolatopsis sp. cg5 TaxID=3238802 RepID=UPI00352441FD